MAINISAIIFFGIAVIAVILAVVIAVVMRRRKNGEIASGEKTSPVTAAAGSVMRAVPVSAPGSAGEIKLYDVPDKQAAMVMAIVADHLRAPLNRLRFKSIKRID